MFEVDAQLPVITREMRPVDMAAYAAATFDFARLHYDADHARAHGFTGPVVDGQMLGALVALALQSWAGPDAILRGLRFRNRRPVVAADVVEFRGRVIDSSDEATGTLVRCRWQVRNQHDDEVLDDVEATVWIPWQLPR